MVERVALELQRHWLLTEGSAFDQPDDWQAFARAALCAMREPTEAMLLAGYETALGRSPGKTDRWMLTNIWRAMIDAARAER